MKHDIVYSEDMKEAFYCGATFKLILAEKIRDIPFKYELEKKGAEE